MRREFAPPHAPKKNTLHVPTGSPVTERRTSSDRTRSRWLVSNRVTKGGRGRGNGWGQSEIGTHVEEEIKHNTEWKLTKVLSGERLVRRGESGRRGARSGERQSWLGDPGPSPVTFSEFVGMRQTCYLGHPAWCKLEFVTWWRDHCASWLLETKA